VGARAAAVGCPQFGQKRPSGLNSCPQLRQYLSATFLTYSARLCTINRALIKIRKSAPKLRAATSRKLATWHIGAASYTRVSSVYDRHKENEFANGF
jgi:hypothetical protein